MGHRCDALFRATFTIFKRLGGEAMMMIDWVFGGIAFISVVLAIGKYAYTRKQIENGTEKEPIHSCLCQECANFKPKE